MKILILYYSKGGNTKKLAHAVLEGVDSVEGVQGILKSTREVTKEDFIEAGGIIAGSPVYFGTMAAQLKAVFDDFVSTRRKMDGKVGAAFATSGDPTGGKETTMMSIIQALLIYGMVISGDPFSATGPAGVAWMGAPADNIRETAGKVGERVAQLSLKLSD